MLNSEQTAFFKSQGYLLLPGVLDQALCSQAQDALWASLPLGSDICREDPATHIGPFSKRDTQHKPTDSRVGYRWQLRENGTSELLINLMYSENNLRVAEHLLGEGCLQQPVVNGRVMGSNG